MEKATLKTARFVLLFVLIVSLNGCATKCKNCFKYGKTLAYYNPSDCKDLPKGRFQCNNVVFERLTIDVRVLF